jgi:hypothetical protein
MTRGANVEALVGLPIAVVVEVVAGLRVWMAGANAISPMSHRSQTSLLAVVAFAHSLRFRRTGEAELGGVDRAFRATIIARTFVDTPIAVVVQTIGALGIFDPGLDHFRVADSPATVFRTDVVTFPVAQAPPHVAGLPDEGEILVSSSVAVIIETIAKLTCGDASTRICMTLVRPLGISAFVRRAGVTTVRPFVSSAIVSQISCIFATKVCDVLGSVSDFLGIRTVVRSGGHVRIRLRVCSIRPAQVQRPHIRRAKIRRRSYVRHAGHPDRISGRSFFRPFTPGAANGDENGQHEERPE